MNETILSVRDLTISFRTAGGLVRAVRGISFRRELLQNRFGKCAEYAKKVYTCTLGMII